MKRLIALAMIAAVAVTAVYAQETVSLGSSNQSQTTLGFEMNEYDFLVNPLYLGLLSDPWLFFALDTQANQFGSGIPTGGFKAGWALGGDSTPVVLAHYRTATTNLDTATPADNVEITRSGYDIALGTYATIVESVSENAKRNQQVHDLVLHGGLSLSEAIALVFQFGMAIDRWTVESTDYTNTYSNTAAISAASLTSKGDLTETAITMRSANFNNYRLDVEAGLGLGNLSSRVILGLGWYNPHSANNRYEETVTVYDAGGGLDDTVRDLETITTFAGQYTTAGGVPTPSFTMGTPGLVWAENFGVGIDSQTTLPLSEKMDLNVPFAVGLTLYPADLQTAETTTIVLYDDASAASLESGRDATTTATSLARSLDLTASTGADISTSVMPAENTLLHLGAGLDLGFGSASESKIQTRTQRNQVDNDGDGLYTTAGTDVDFTYVESGYEVQSSEFNYMVGFTIESAVSYTPIPILTFHAGISTGLSIDMTATRSLTTGDSNFVFEQYTDNLDAANSYVLRQKDGIANDSIPDSGFTADIIPTTGSAFGFTLNFSDNFKIDARSIYSGNVGFSEFSVLGMYSY